MKAYESKWNPSCLISVIMAAYNSEKTIEMALKSIRTQEFDQSQIEILVIDGGSTDSTLEIAHKYDAEVIFNEARLPEPGKIKGMQLAKGKYVLIMDSDEEMVDSLILKNRYDFLESYKFLHCLSIGTINPPEYSSIGVYINAVGDPFSCFIYKTYSDGVNKLIWNRNILKDQKRCIGEFKISDIRPIGDSGVMMDMEFIHDNYPDDMDRVNTSTIFDRIIRDTGYVGCIKDDDHIHRSKSDFHTYIKKLKFRVVNNVHSVDASGYGSRSQNSDKLRIRKYLFPFYAISMIFPIMDGVRMSINYSNPVFLLHPIFTWYVMIEIVYQFWLKLIKRRQSIQTYGE